MMLSRVRGRACDVAFYLPTVSGLLAGGAAGGAESQVMLLARALAAAGVRVSLIVYPNEELPASIEGVRIVQRLDTKAQQRGIGKLREAMRIHRAFVAADAQVVIGRVAGPEVAIAAVVARLSGRRFVYSSASLLDFACFRSLLRWHDAALYRLALRLAQPVVVQTREQAESCFSAIGKKSIVIPSIAERAPRQAIPPDAFLWAGRVEPNKRPMEYVALARRNHEASFRMVAIPTVGHEGLFKQILDAAGSARNLQVLQPRARGELGELIDRTVAVVSTSEYEGMPNVFLESWARGVPALSLSHDPDGVIERYGLGFCAGGDAVAFAKYAEQLWDERNRRDDLGRRCRRFVAERHAPEAVALQWRRVLDLDECRGHATVAEASTR